MSGIENDLEKVSKELDPKAIKDINKLENKLVSWEWKWLVEWRLKDMMWHILKVDKNNEGFDFAQEFLNYIWKGEDSADLAFIELWWKINWIYNWEIDWKLENTKEIINSSKFKEFYLNFKSESERIWVETTWFVVWEIEKWNTVDINFRWNVSAEYNIGLSDLMPPKVKRVKVEWVRTINGETVWQPYSLLWERKWTKWGFYTAGWQYMPVFTWFKVTILDTYTDEELQKMEIDKSLKIASLKTDPKIQEFKNKYWDEELNLILKTAVEYDIDPFFVMTLRQTENWWKWKEFGIMRDGCDNFERQLVLCCRTMQNNMQRFKLNTWKDAINDWEISKEFIAFFSSIYAPIGAENDPNWLNQNHLWNLLKIYGAYRGFEISDTQIASLRESNNVIYRKIFNELVEVTWKTNPNDLIRVAQHYVGIRYQRWGGHGWFDWMTLDCSWLVIQAMKETWVVPFNFESTASWLYSVVQSKSLRDVERWDLVFLEEPDGRISHVEIATGPLENWRIPIIHAWKSARGVVNTHQSLSYWNWRVLVGKPKFY